MASRNPRTRIRKSGRPGIGIEPDVSVERRLADVVSNRDVVLAREEELAGAK
jgi:hypothetical protein